MKDVWKTVYDMKMVIKCENISVSSLSGETENVDKLIKKCLLDTFRQTDEDFLKKASSQ